MKYANEVFTRLSKGQFLSSNSIDPRQKVVYDDVEENFADYADFFAQIDFVLEAGNGYYYFSRQEGRLPLENKLKGLFVWIDYVDFLKTFDNGFGSGTQFNLAQIEVRLTEDVELKDKLSALFTDRTSNREKLEALVKALTDQGFAENISELDGTYQVTDAFHYIEDIIQTIVISEDASHEISE